MTLLTKLADHALKPLRILEPIDNAVRIRLKQTEHSTPNAAELEDRDEET